MIQVLYHANCTDGSGAALAAFIALGDTAEYIPVQYRTPPPKIHPAGIVYIVDFSYPKDVLIKMAETASSIIVLDHHKTAKEDLESLDHPLIHVHFNMEKSGAVLTWEYFHPAQAVPPLFQSIQDRDLWKFNMAGSKEIHRALGMFENWHDWTPYLYETGLLIDDGRAIISYLDVQIERIINNKPVEFFATNEEVPIYNLPGFLISDALDAALEKYPECRYAVGFITLPDKTIYSLRSRTGSDVDVSEIARQYKGGGHKHAAGFSVKTHA